MDAEAAKGVIETRVDHTLQQVEGGFQVITRIDATPIRMSVEQLELTIPSEYAKRFADNNPVVRQQVTLLNVIAIPGGLPIKLGDEVVGGVGASGSPGVDEPCVQEGIDKVADQPRQ